MGAAVGILITVSLAAAAAVVLVLVRNRVGKLLWIEVFLKINSKDEIECYFSCVEVVPTSGAPTFSIQSLKVMGISSF